ncbi:MAG: sulfatase-like hydrolase/transferase [Spirochaetota bacterium]
MNRKPNVLFIVVDDMGYGDFGVFGDGSPQTPRLDALVSDGCCFTQHYSGAPVCAPARAALLTGRYALRTGVIDTQDANGLDRIHTDEQTVGDVFSRAGYATGLIGKWHSGAYDPRYHPTRRGFSEFAGFQGGWSDYYDFTLQVGRGTRRGTGEYMTDVLTQEALGFLERHQNESFFLSLNYNAPHFPFQAPAADVERFSHPEDAHPDLRTLYAMIYRMDEGLGRVLDKLRELGLEEQTLVIFTSDNGPQMSPNVRRYNARWAGSKGNVYEGGIRVPAAVRWPGRVEAGAMSDELVHFVDWLPTLASICDLPLHDLPAPLDGADVSTTLLDGRASYDGPRFWQWNRYEPVARCNAAVRDGAWKLLYPEIDEAMQLSEHDITTDKYFKAHPDEATHVVPALYERNVPEPHPPQLYNLEADPYEEHDLAGREPERTAALARRLESWFEEVERERTAKEQGYAR